MGNNTIRIFKELFGPIKGKKLNDWLNPCCGTFCNDVLNCVGVNGDAGSDTVLAANGTFVSRRVTPNTATAVNTTGAISANELAGGLITSTSAATVIATLPTATALATQIGAVRGTVIDFVVDNSAGANTVTVAVNTGITVGTTALTGGDDLVVTVAQAVAVYKIIFTSTTTAILRRIV